VPTLLAVAGIPARAVPQVMPRCDSGSITSAVRQVVDGRIWTVTGNPSEVFADLLASLHPDRMQHSITVGRKVASVAHLVPAPLRSDLIVAGTLHDIGYGHPISGFHPIDGARYLAKLAFQLWFAI